MLTFLARMKIKGDKEDEFIDLVKKLTEKTLAAEPGCTAYQFYRLREGELSFAVLEAFVDEAAEEAHRNSDHFNELAPSLIECIEGTYVREYLDPLE
ncbi:MAG: putative quinol monooxygenase [Proteobacteria bacterium]|nr:putative quinol monooxygenase [Pseudomonadota bacterium]